MHVKKITEYDNMYDAALYGNIENIKWLRSKGMEWDECIFYNAVENGNLVNMKWLLENGCPCDDNAMIVVTQLGNFTI